ncbi:MAG: hypothetical protein RLZZ237_373 [Pseudomonadota bacterium]|jgi:acetyltransferase-like isoleucine patch superfamily enzyme
MREIAAREIVVFLCLLALILVLGIVSAVWLVAVVPRNHLNDLRGVALVAAAAVLIYLYAFAVYRLFLRLFPLHEGAAAPGSCAEFAANVNILFYLMLFNALIRTHFLPLPLLRLVYLALGARLGHNSYSAGALLDPPLTSIGSNSIVGHDAVVFAHVIEGQRLALKRVVIGDGVTIGAHAVIMAGTRIGDGAIISVGAVLTKDSVVGPGEIWGGIPARLLKKTEAATQAAAS